MQSREDVPARRDSGKGDAHELAAHAENRLPCQSCYGHGYFVNHDGTMTPCDHRQFKMTSPSGSTLEGPLPHERTTIVQRGEGWYAYTAGRMDSTGRLDGKE